MKKFISISLSIAVLTYSLLVAAAHRSSPDEAKAFFDNAISYVNEVGEQKAVVAFNDPDGEFVKGDLYVFALSSDGLYLANGAFPQLKGQPISGVKNATGQEIYEVITSAVNNADGLGVAEYEWLNPQTNQLEKKSAYVQTVEDIIVGVGYYE